MQTRIGMTVALLLATISVSHADERPPVPNVKPVSSDADVIKALDGQTRKITIYDFTPPAIVTGSWNWKTKTINVDVGKEKIKKTWDVKGGKYCVKGEPCRSLYEEGGKVYEVNPNGKVHAVSE